MKSLSVVLIGTGLAMVGCVALVAGFPRVAAQEGGQHRAHNTGGALAALQQLQESSLRRNDFPFDSVVLAQQDLSLGRKTLYLNSILDVQVPSRFSVHTIGQDDAMDLRTVSLFVNDYVLFFYIFEELDMNAIDLTKVRWYERHAGPQNSTTYQIDPPIRLSPGNAILVFQSASGDFGGSIDMTLHGTTVPGINLADTLRVE